MTRHAPTRRAGRLTLAILLLAGLVSLTGTTLAAEPTKDHGAKLPPLIDREAFFGDPEISGSQLSPDGEFISFIKPLDGTRNLWVKKTGEAFEKARPLTAQTKRPIRAYFWSRDSRYLLFVQDEGGDENFNIFAVDPKEKLAEGERVPEARNLTDLEGVRAFIYSVPKSKPDVLFVGLNDRDPSWHDLYELSLSTGELKLLRENNERVARWVFDLEGKLRLAGRTTESGDTEILRVDDDGFTAVYTCSVFESCAPVRFHRDGKRVYMQTNRGEPDLTRLVLFNPQTGKEELVESDPEGRVDFGGTVFSSKTDELVATVYTDERTRIYFRDEDYERDYERLKKKLPGYEVRPSSSTQDERLWLVAAYSDTEPGKSYLYDRKTRDLTFQYEVFEDIPREHLAPMTSVRYKSSDGLEIPAFLTLPKGPAAKNLPLVVMPHGGPWARDTWGYDPYAQFLANRGFAVLQPNFRSSTGYGKAFLNAGNQEWGELMQDDITWGVKHLIEKGIADPDRVAIMGGSYGGYATLAGVTFTPDLYAAAVSIVGPSNLITLLESIPPYWESIRTIFHARMGDPNTEEGRKLLEKQSPLNSAEKIATPLLVVQGANDPRVKKAESDQIVVALRDREFPVEYIVAPDEGHGFAKPVNNMAMIAAIERFFHRHIGTRYQEGATPEVAARLAEITVDPATVTLPKQIDATTVEPLEPAADLEPMTASYQSTIEMGGQQVQLASTLSIEDDGGRWKVVETTTTPQGPVTDTTYLAKGSLEIVERAVDQAAVKIQMTVAEGQISGSLNMMGNETPISSTTDGPLFGDGAGAGTALGRLPLAEGYSAVFRVFDIQTQRVKLRKLDVTGIESVTVPAGAFEAFRVEVSSPEGDPGSLTVWIDTASRRHIKTEAIVPQMNGAKVTTELQP